MKSDLAGLLQNAIGCPKHLRAYYKFSIDELLNNLREVKRRAAAGDTAVVAEFFEIYVLDANESEQAKIEQQQLNSAQRLLNELEGKATEARMMDGAA